MKQWICLRCNQVIGSGKPFECCGTVELFEPAKHGAMLVSASNSWITVYSRWQKHPLLRQIGMEWAEDGNFSAPRIFNEFVQRLIDDSEPTK